MKTFKITGLFLATLLLFTSCSDDDNGEYEPKGDYETGFFISNEGPFNNGTGTITHVSDDGTVEQNVYKSVNNEDLGNIVQSMHLVNDNAYVVVNNSNKIVVANRFTMEKEIVIQGAEISNPRHMVSTNERGFISNWGDAANPDDDFIAVIDLDNNVVTATIPVGEGPEDMLINGEHLYVNLQGGWGQNNKVQVIDINSNNLVKTIEVGDVPNSIIEDDKGDVWVLCAGKPSWSSVETKGQLAQINGSNFGVTFYDFELGQHPEHLTFDGSSVYYYLNGKVFGMPTVASEIPSDPINGIEGYFYSMSTYNGELYATDAKDFAQEGSLKVFSLNNGTLVQTIETGIIPGGVVFQ